MSNSDQSRSVLSSDRARSKEDPTHPLASQTSSELSPSLRPVHHSARLLTHASRFRSGSVIFESVCQHQVKSSETRSHVLIVPVR